MKQILALFCLATLSLVALAQAKKTEPTQGAVSYGTHPRQLLDFYQAKSDKPTPVLFFIHGGGWVAGERRVADLDKYLAEGISVVAISYRFILDAHNEGINPPVRAPLYDAARALQFVRSKAKEWNLDKARIAASGGSAGACSSLWLAFHKDLAEPESKDSISRESTRLWCAAVTGAQTTLDPKQMKEWTPNSRYGGHAFGFPPASMDLKSRDTQFAKFLEARATLLPFIQEFSPMEHVTADDPPIYLIYAAPPAMGQPAKDPTHSANFGVKLKEKLDLAGVDCELVYPGATKVKHPSMFAYLAEKLKAPEGKLGGGQQGSP